VVKALYFISLHLGSAPCLLWGCIIKRSLLGHSASYGHGCVRRKQPTLLSSKDDAIELMCNRNGINVQLEWINAPVWGKLQLSPPHEKYYTNILLFFMSIYYPYDLPTLLLLKMIAIEMELMHLCGDKYNCHLLNSTIILLFL